MIFFRINFSNFLILYFFVDIATHFKKNISTDYCNQNCVGEAWVKQKIEKRKWGGGYCIQPAGVNTCIYLKKESLKLISLVRSG